MVPNVLSALPQMIYCNAEGVAWIDNYRVVVASDKAKSKQPFWCVRAWSLLLLFAAPVHSK
jgi:hypothetical protein